MNHVKCISEDQKYGGKGFEAKANKGDVKQQQWMQVNISTICLYVKKKKGKNIFSYPDFVSIPEENP